ncbi:MAG TPA: glycosyltransferase family 39 protein [Terriglobales bacterium]|nr:glycosyltransferase family 39 protein [Terriglobales bacterium]
MLREHRGFFLAMTLCGLVLRLFFLIYFPALTDDSHVYLDLAGNWLEHGVYGQTEGGDIVPVDTRLPGYPAFLAAIFWVFGVGKIRTVLMSQILIDLAGCFLIADLARRTVSPRAGRIAFVLAALCPFLASYAAAVLTETLEVFFTVVALECAVAALEGTTSRKLSRLWLLWAGTGASVAACILLRPDGGILLPVIGFSMLFVLWSERARRETVVSIVTGGLLVAVLALVPLIPWTVRNWKTLHQFQPLAPRYATESEEVTPVGFNRWIRTWMADYVSVEEIYWNVPGDKIDVRKLPRRALDSAGDSTLALIADYNGAPQLTAQIDWRFDQVAWERIRAHPFRYYFVLPVVRVADMWLRPRTELLPADPRWWEFNDEPMGSVAAVGFGLINLLYVVAALGGAIWRHRDIRYFGLLAGFVILRTAFLSTIENPEPRYTLECYPVVIVLAAGLFAGRALKQSNA